MFSLPHSNISYLALAALMKGANLFLQSSDATKFYITITKITLCYLESVTYTLRFSTMGSCYLPICLSAIALPSTCRNLVNVIPISRLGIKIQVQVPNRFLKESFLLRSYFSYFIWEALNVSKQFNKQKKKLSNHQIKK